MNYDLALMALEGLARTPLRVRVAGADILVEGDAAAFKELARLCLLLGGAGDGDDDGFELKPPVHVSAGSMALMLKLSQ